MAAKNISVGIDINIQRSDGRVHTATIFKIDNQNISVEWSENGQSYAKEVDLEDIESLNPNIIASKAEEDQIDESISSTSEEMANAVQNNEIAGSSTSKINTKQPTGFFKKAKLDSRIPEKNEVKAARMTVRKPSTSIATNRRSRVVEEAEFIKKNREERRQKQEEEKNKKIAFLNKGDGHPHWMLLNMINEYRQKLEIEPICYNDAIEDHSIRVCVRKRPLNSREVSRKEVDIITLPNKNQIMVHEPKCKVDLTKYLENHLFYFDYVFNETSSNEFVYRYSAQPLVKSIFEGAFSTCFAYGQTGSGKTHTMGGDLNKDDFNQGIYAMAAADIFALKNSPRYKHCNFAISASFFEIYSEKVFDLLENKTQLRILEDGRMQVQVVGLSEIVVTSVEQVLSLIKRGSQARTSAKTSANSNSSRSHSVFQIILRTSKKAMSVHGKFSLIDLAGNERGADTGTSSKQTRMEGSEINKSLLALKECIRALGKKGSHLPFRTSKLTHVLRDSFIGSNSKTCMIAMISPGNSSCENSLNTLRYAARVKELDANNVTTTNSSNKQELIAIPEAIAEPDLDDILHETIIEENMVEIAEAEETMFDKQRELLESISEFKREGSALLENAETDYYDQNEYCAKWKNLIMKTMESLYDTKELMDDFQKKVEPFNNKQRK